MMISYFIYYGIELKSGRVIEGNRVMDSDAPIRTTEQLRLLEEAILRDVLANTKFDATAIIVRNIVQLD